MKMKIVLLMVAVTSYAPSHAVKVTLPSAEEVAKCMKELRLEHLEEKTKLSKQLGGKTCEALFLAHKISSVIHDEYQNYPVAVLITAQMAQSDLLLVLLKNSPAAIDELKEHKLLE